MQIKRVRISNFRSIKQLELNLCDTTVLIGPNNSGKTAILDAIRIALTRRWGQRGTGFTEYDVHLCADRTDPKIGEPVQIEVEIQESETGEWSEDIQNELADILISDPITSQSSILMRVSCSWDQSEESYIPRWEFLNVERKPLSGKGARAINLQEFFQFLPVFYLEALRDAGDEYSSRSQFWGKLLRTIQIPEHLELRSKRIFDLLNKRLLEADPRLAQLAKGISKISQVASSDGVGTADLRVLPLNTWDLLSKAEVIYRTEEGKPWLPLLRHGQGVQSLSVIFLFKSFVELLLHELFRPDSSAVLALEEPETHLHPQAARSLWKHIGELPGQKIVTSHSPYFLQHVPFRDIRVVRNGPLGSTVESLPESFRVRIPFKNEILNLEQQASNRINYDRGLGELIVTGKLSQKLFRDLLTIYHGQTDTGSIHQALKALYEASQCFISDQELTQLETFAKRIRGEIFFANRWLLVEGQSEFHLVHGIANGLGYNLDEHGVSVIDYKNNGNPDSFAVLARALGYPWIILVDGDAAGKSYIKAIENRGFDSMELKDRSILLPNGYLEQQLVHDGLQDELKAILIELGIDGVASLNDIELVEALVKCKTSYAVKLANRCETDKSLLDRMPSQLLDLIRALQGLR